MVRGFLLNLEYEGLHAICSSYDQFEHKEQWMEFLGGVGNVQEVKQVGNSEKMMIELKLRWM